MKVRISSLEIILEIELNNNNTWDRNSLDKIISR